jgi:hypothetical protein
MVILRKHFQSLLEVLIAFVLIVLCILPLVYPHVAMYQSQMRFIREIELDHVVNLLYAKVLEKLYMNSISWNSLEQQVFPIDTALLNEIQFDRPLHYIGSYNFFEAKPRFKPKKKGAPLSIYLYHLTFNFLPKEFEKSPEEIKKKKTIKYQYDVFIVRDLRGS